MVFSSPFLSAPPPTLGLEFWSPGLWVEGCTAGWGGGEGELFLHIPQRVPAPNWQSSSQKSPHTHPVPHDYPWVLSGGRPHYTEVTEEEEEGANSSQVWEGLGRGKSLNPKAATGLWNPRH